MHQGGILVACLGHVMNSGQLLEGDINLLRQIFGQGARRGKTGCDQFPNMAHFIMGQNGLC